MGNLVTNPGFDQDLSGWKISNTGTSAAKPLGSEDAAGCPFSGALQITSAPDTTDEAHFDQCVLLTTAGPYNVGVQWKVLDPTNSGITCSVGLTFDSTCATDGSGPSMFYLSDVYPVLWSGYGANNQGITTTVSNPVGYSHLHLNCAAFGGIAVDMIYVNAAAAAY